MELTHLKPRREWATGRLVWGLLRNGVEHPAALGKCRPLVVIERHGAQLVVVGLTSKSHTLSGHARIPVPDYVAVGLRRQGFLWGPRTDRVGILDVEAEIGWADDDLIEAILGHVVMPTPQRLLLRAYQADLRPAA